MMQKDFLSSLNLKPGVREVTLVIKDLDHTENLLHSGGGEQKNFETPYSINVRCRAQLKSFCRNLQQAGNVLLAYATFGDNEERVRETARTLEIYQEPLFVELGFEPAITGKNRHISRLVQRYREVLAPYAIEITRVILIDDDGNNVRLLTEGDGDFILVHYFERTNNLNLKLEAVKVNRPRLETVVVRFAEGEEKKVPRTQFDPELGYDVCIETVRSKAEFLATLASVEQRLGIGVRHSENPQRLMISPTVSNVVRPPQENSRHESTYHFRKIQRNRLTRSCGATFRYQENAEPYEAELLTVDDRALIEREILTKSM